MADNVPITAGSGTNIATDDAGAGGHVQIVKLAIGTDGSATVIPADAANGLDVDVTRLPALVTGTATIGAVNVKPAASGGLGTYHLVSLATTNVTNIKASAGQVFGWYIYNSNAAARKVAFHNTAGVPTAGVSVHSSLVIPPLSAANVELTNGISFSTGIAISTVTGLLDNDAVAVAANDLIINIYYA